MKVTWFWFLTMTSCCVVIISTVVKADEDDSSPQRPISITRQVGCKSSVERKRRSAMRSWSYGGGQPRYTARSTRTFSTDEIDAFNEGLHRKRPKFIGKRQAIDPSTSNRDGNALPLPPPPRPEVVAAMSRLHQLADDCSGSKQDEELRYNDGGWPVSGDEQKRGPTRKFLGRRSSGFSESVRSEVSGDDVPPAFVGSDADFARRSASDGSTAVPRRKFVGKRNRKFVGRRSQYNGMSMKQSDVESPMQSDDVIDEQSTAENIKSKAHDLLVGKLLADELLAEGNNPSEKRGRKFVG